MKKLIVRLLLASLLLTLAVVVFRTAVILHGDNVPVPAICTLPCAIESLKSDGAGFVGSYDQLPDRSGFEIGGSQFNKGPWCEFARWRHSLVYWSCRDRSLCIVNPELKSRWISVDRLLASDTDVWRVYASQDFIYLNVRDKGGPLKVLRVVPSTGKITVLPGVVDVRAHDNSDGLVSIRSDGTAVISSGKCVARVTGVNIGATDSWDADPSAGVICWQNRRLLKVYSKGKIIGSDLGKSLCRGVSVSPNQRVIWASMDITDLPIPCFWEAQARVYNYTGAYLGSKIFCASPAEPPMMPYDPALSQIAYKISRDTKDYFEYH